MERILHKPVSTIGDYDVLVAGAGPAGICAAVAAARSGCRVAMLERFGVVGGNLTVGHVRTSMGAVASSPLLEETAQLLNGGGSCLAHHVEEAKIALTEWLEREKVTVFLQTPVVEVLQEDGIVRGLYISTQQGICLITGRAIVDATGDGMVAALAGTPWAIGRQDGLMQPASVMFTLTGVDPDCTLVCTHEQEDTPLGDTTYLRLCEQASRSGELPKNVSIVRLYATACAGERLVNATQINGVNGLETADVRLSQVELRKQMRQILIFLQKYIPGFAACQIQDSGDIVGFRETRRIQGQYTLTSADISAGRTFPDVVVHRANFPFDIHNPDGGGQAEDFESAHSTQPYDIPYRCFLPLGTDGLLVAGRCMSGTHRAHSSYRVMNICMAMGEAVGTAAALCAQRHILPAQLPYADLQAQLQQNGVSLFGA